MKKSRIGSWIYIVLCLIFLYAPILYPFDTRLYLQIGRTDTVHR